MGSFCVVPRNASIANFPEWVRGVVDNGAKDENDGNEMKRKNKDRFIRRFSILPISTHTHTLSLSPCRTNFGCGEGDN